MGWLFLLLLVALGFGALWRFGELSRSTLELVAAALFLAVTGYALQGSPNVEGSPVQSREARAKIDVKDITAKRALRSGVGEEAAALDLTDALIRAGATQEAAIAARTAIAKHPNDAELWVGLGNALVAHGDGQITPAAEYAFQHAAQLSPEHPGPPFFFGLALAQQGKTAEAGQVWRGLLARAPADAPWKADLEQRLAAIGESPVPKTDGPARKP